MDNLYSQSGLLLDAFVKTVDGKQTGLYTLTNPSGSEVAVTNYGAKIVSILVPNKEGEMVDVVLGHPTINDYLSSEEPYFGAVCGRVANRIAKGSLPWRERVPAGCEQRSPARCTGYQGFNAVVWEVKKVTENSIELFYLSPDGEEKYR